MKKFLIGTNAAFFSLMLFSFLLPHLGLAQDFRNVPSVIHVQSNISDGKFSVEQIVNLAEKKKIKVVVITDTLLRSWEYGIWPFARVLKRVLAEPSVFKYGVKKYLREVSEVQIRHPTTIVLAGIEVAPFYFWEGNYFKQTLILHNWHKKFLVLGLKDARDLRRMPVAGNYAHIPQNFDNWLNFWPIGILSLGIILIKLKKKKRFSFGGQLYSEVVTPFKTLGYILVVLGALGLLAAFSFPVSEFDPYHGEQGIKPYQALIDYVNKHNGLTFWTHPEANFSDRFLGARVVTPGYKDDLLRSFGYTGFAGIYHDNSTATKPGEVWDRILSEYSSGKRKEAAWIFGETQWDGFKESWDIASIETILLLEDLNQDEVLKALRQGRMYAQLNFQPNSFSLDKFCVTDDKRSGLGFMGDDIKISGAALILIKMSFADYQAQETRLKLIKDGRVIKEFKAKGAKIAIAFRDGNLAPQSKSFYRLEINNDVSLILTNPIFVSGQK